MPRHFPLPIRNASNVISERGHELLDDATELLLQDLKHSRKVVFSTARTVLAQQYDVEIQRAKSKKKFSLDAILKRASDHITVKVARNGVYIIPLFLASSSPSTDFFVGPVRILGKAAFLSEYEEILKGNEPAPELGDEYERWAEYSLKYDHFACVHVEGYEYDKAWKIAQETAEFLLNLIRICFGFSHTSRIRTGFRSLPESREVRVSVSEAGRPAYSRKYTTTTTHLPENWPEQFVRTVGLGLPLLGAYLTWMLSGDGEGTPVLERTVYANRLLAEAYSEPHAPMRLVRAVSALESLAVVPSSEKARSVARRCAIVGGAGSPKLAVEIYDAVAEAYRIRNMVVHGDLPIDDNKASAAFLYLDDFLLEILLGFYGWYRLASKQKPMSVGKLRREIDAMEMWVFWNPELIFE